MYGTCGSKDCNHFKGKHKDGKGPCRILGCKCAKFKPKGLLGR
jgi:hypothetical protein